MTTPKAEYVFRGPSCYQDWAKVKRDIEKQGYFSGSELSRNFGLGDRLRKLRKLAKTGKIRAIYVDINFTTKWYYNFFDVKAVLKRT